MVKINIKFKTLATKGMKVLKKNKMRRY